MIRRREDYGPVPTVNRESCWRIRLVCDTVPDLLVQVCCKPRVDSQKATHSDRYAVGVDSCNPLRRNALPIIRVDCSGTTRIRRLPRFGEPSLLDMLKAQEAGGDLSNAFRRP